MNSRAETGKNPSRNLKGVRVSAAAAVLRPYSQKRRNDNFLIGSSTCVYQLCVLRPQADYGDHHNFHY